MSLNFQTLRSFVHQKRCLGRMYTLNTYGQNLGGGTKFRGLHSLTLNKTKTGCKLELLDMSKCTLSKGKVLGKSRSLASVFIISRNESTSTTGSVLDSSSVPRNSVVNANSLSSSPSSTIEVSTNAVSATPSPLESSSIQQPEVTETISSHAAPIEASVDGPLIFEKIPEPPALPVEELAGAVLGEPSFASLGLGGWSPSGIVQQCLEYFHVTLGMPWWASIMTGTIIVRLLLFPLVVKSQRNAARMQNHSPQLQILQMKMTEARNTGNALMAAKYGQDMFQFMKEKDISPLKSLMVPLAMAPVFISCFFGLRKMANLPVESLKEGGLFWFTDLTLADPYYILPLITSVTVWITLEVGADGMRVNNPSQGQLMKYFMRAIPVIMFPFTLNFPAAILCYWVSTNAISLVQVSLLKIPAIRDKLKIEPIRKIKSDMLPGSDKGFRESFKESWTNMKISREIQDRQRYDEISFKRAGRGPIPKTYKYDPTKVDASDATAVQAKQK